MSDHFQMLVDVDVTPAKAEEVVDAVFARFRKLGLITGRANRDCVLDGTGYRPGAALPDFYQLGKRELRFWELATCGVEGKTGRSFNQWALGPACEGFTCPSCNARIEPFNDDFGAALGSAIDAWMEQSGRALIACPECRRKIPINEWVCDPPLGFGNASFTFWNWPRFDSPAWRIDVAGIVREATGHDIVWTYGGFWRHEATMSVWALIPES